MGFHLCVSYLLTAASAATDLTFEIVFPEYVRISVESDEETFSGPKPRTQNYQNSKAVHASRGKFLQRDGWNMFRMLKINPWINQNSKAVHEGHEVATEK